MERRDLAAERVDDSLNDFFATRAGHHLDGERLPKEVRHDRAARRILDQVAAHSPHRKRAKKFQRQPREVDIDGSQRTPGLRQVNVSQ